MNFSLVEAVAAFFGVVGTLLLATKSRAAGWGFVAFLVSNAGWLYFSYVGGHRWMFVQQVFFTISSLIGIYVWLLHDRLLHDRLLRDRLQRLFERLCARARGDA